MTSAITRCPSCGMSFRVSESQLRMADGAVRCGACLSVFQAEEYFISPPIDVTEQLAIIQDYWSDFDRYLYQVAAPAGFELDSDALSEPASGEPVDEPVDHDPFDEPEEDPEELLVPAPRVRPLPLSILDPLGVPASRQDSEPEAAAFEDGYDAIPVLDEEISEEEFEEAFAAYADAGLMPLDTEAPETAGQTDLFDAMGEPVMTLSDSSDYALPENYERALDGRDDGSRQAATMQDYFDQESVTEVNNTGLTITATRDSRPDDDPGVIGLALGIESDPEELTAARKGGITNAMLGWAAASIAMVLLGIVQFAYFNMDFFAQKERYRPAYEKACRYLRCDVPPYDNIELLRTRELIVRTHPTEPNALTVDVLLSNNGDFRQLFPGLELTFFNIDGEKTASRVFTVAEYLGGELRGLRYIPARTEVRLSLELVDPGNEALGYQMQVVPL